MAKALESNLLQTKPAQAPQMCTRCSGHSPVPLTHLFLRCLCQLPAISFEVVQLVKLHADVFNGQLEEIPKSSQVLGCGSGIGIRVLEEEALKTPFQKEHTQQNTVPSPLLHPACNQTQ